MAKKGKRRNQTQLILQALAAAEASINLAKQLLSAYGGPSPSAAPSGRPLQPAAEPTRGVPGIVGKFDGDFMVTADGRKYAVPSNYASKSQIVYGDSLKMIEKPDGTKVFKQIERVKRARVSGILAKKDGRWCVVTADGSYKVLPAAVAHHAGREGDEARVLIPLGDRQAPFAAVEALPTREEGERKEEPREGAVEERERAPEPLRAGVGEEKKKKKEKPEKPTGEKEKEAAPRKPAKKREEVGRKKEKPVPEKRKKGKTEPEKKKKKEKPEKPKETKASPLMDEEEELR